MSTIQTTQPEEIHPDILLVNRAREGDVQAFEQLVKQYDRQVFRIAQHITQNREDAEDVVQDAFLKAYEKLDQFQGNSKFYTWLVRIAVNESLMRLRKRRTGRMVSIDEEGFQESDEMTVPPEAARQLSKGKFWDQVRDITTHLPRMEREVFYLRFFDQLSIKEITAAMHKNESTVKTHLYRALSKVKAAAEAADLTEENL